MISDFTSISKLQEAGFAGFITIGKLIEDQSCLPKEKGVYMVLSLSSTDPQFSFPGTGGHFKNRDPNLPIQTIANHWVKNTPVIYIGKAGANGGSATLRSRLRQYLLFGQGKRIGHWGGRLIWQIAKCNELVLCWKVLPREEPREVEKVLIQNFIAQYGRRPFANLAD